MSSVYRVLCLSHDPAMDTGGEWHSSRDGHTIAPAAALDPAAHQETELHAGCDLVVGRYSYPLVEVCCPGGRHTGLTHRGPVWVEAEWLRLLWHAQQAPEDSPIRRAAAGAAMACWPHDRLGKLHRELDLEPTHLPEG